ncbi:MAG: LytTR family transcriptional regulator [Ruminococcaceae bacterium]|nr:LytTR family transcriptional regulator [Oscillospiraceae bacterium]
MNVLICSPEQEEASFFSDRLQFFFGSRGIEPIILCFRDIADMSEYLSVCPDSPDVLILTFPVLNMEKLDTVQELSDTLPGTDIVLIGDNPSDVERLYAMGVFYFFYPRVSRDSFAFFEKKLQKHRFSDAEKYFILENRQQTIKIAYSDILYVMSDKRKIVIYQPNGKTDSIYCRLDEFEGQLDDRFIRCHQSYLINVEYIRGIDVDGFIMIDDIFVPISRKKYWESKRKYIKYVKEQG